MGDRIAVLRKGLLQQLGTPDELYQSPANLFVAEFIGSPPMNILTAAVKRSANGHELVARLAAARRCRRAPSTPTRRCATATARGSLSASARRASRSPRGPTRAGCGWWPTSSWWRTCRPEKLVHLRVDADPVVTDATVEIAQDIDAAAARGPAVPGRRLGRACPAQRSRGRARRRPGRVRRRAVGPALLRPVHRPGDPARPRPRPSRPPLERRGRGPHEHPAPHRQARRQPVLLPGGVLPPDDVPRGLHRRGGPHRRARDRDHPRAVDPGLPAADRRVRRHLVLLDGEVRDDAGRHRPLPRHQALPGPLADPRGADRLVPPRHRHRGAARREGRPRDHQHPAGGHGGGRAVRGGEGRPAAAGGARALPLRAPVDPAAPRGHAPDRFAGAGPDARHGHVRRAVPARGQRAGTAGRRQAGAGRPDRARPTTTTATPTPWPTSSTTAAAARSTSAWPASRRTTSGPSPSRCSSTCP